MTAAPAKPARRRRWPWVLALMALALATGAWWVNRQLEPERLTATVLARAGTALGLELSIEGTPEYALRPEPRLVLPGLTVRQPGASASLLQASQVEVSLPWRTLWRAEEVIVTRIALVRPRVDIAALSQWLRERPASDEPFTLPTITEGVHASGGEVTGATWSLRDLELALPELRPGAPAKLDASGRFQQQELSLDVAAELALATAGLASDYTLQASGRITRGTLDVPYAVDANGRFDARGPVLELQANTLQLRSQSPMPDLDAKGAVSYGEDTLGLSLGGQLPQWPADWPALPAPLLAERGVDFSIDYGGPPDLSADAAVQVWQDEARLDAVLALPVLQAWLGDEGAGPLPPLQGTFAAPALVVEGFTLEGVRVELEDEDATPASGDRP